MLIKKIKLKLCYVYNLYTGKEQKIIFQHSKTVIQVNKVMHAIDK
jgi:hypothetical protein